MVCSVGWGVKNVLQPNSAVVRSHHGSLDRIEKKQENEWLQPEKTASVSHWMELLCCLWKVLCSLVCSLVNLSNYWPHLLKLYSELPWKRTERAADTRPPLRSVQLGHRWGRWVRGPPVLTSGIRHSWNILLVCHKCLRWEYPFKSWYRDIIQSLNGGNI